MSVNVFHILKIAQEVSLSTLRIQYKYISTMSIFINVYLFNLDLIRSLSFSN